MMGISYEFHLSGIENTQLLQSIKMILNDFILNSIFLNRDGESVNDASLRLEKSEAPSSSNKPEMKDCLIIEHYLKLSKELRNRGFNKKIFFITSNTSDYGKIKSLKSPLDVQFLRLDILYRNNYHWIGTDIEKDIKKSSRP